MEIFAQNCTFLLLDLDLQTQSLDQRVYFEFAEDHFVYAANCKTMVINVEKSG